MADAVIQDTLIQATKAIEDQLDAEIQRLETLDDDELEVIRQRRLANMGKAVKQKEQWLQAGHGKYFEVADEKEFFAECKKSKNVVCHFYRDSTMRCKIVDKHLEILARSHVETKFIKINIEKAVFLAERLKVVVIPTICIAKDGKTVDYIVGFTDLGNTDEFSTEMLEWRLGMTQVINYSGDLTTPPVAGQKEKKFMRHEGKKTIRGNNDDSSDDDGFE